MRSNQNSFSTLGFSDDEAVVDALRADLADIVRGFIEKSQLTQTALQKTLGIPQSTISAIKNDRIDHLSVEYFVKILTRARVPWTAKCWNAPHDAACVAGGVSQLFAFDSQGAPAFPVSVADFWYRLTPNYSLVGSPTEAKPVTQSSPSDQNA